MALKPPLPLDILEQQSLNLETGRGSQVRIRSKALLQVYVEERLRNILTILHGLQLALICGQKERLRDLQLCLEPNAAKQTLSALRYMGPPVSKLLRIKQIASAGPWMGRMTFVWSSIIGGST